MLLLTDSNLWEDGVMSPEGEDEALALDVRVHLQKLLNRDRWLKEQILALSAVVTPEAITAALNALAIAEQAQGLIQAVLNAKDQAAGAAQDAQDALAGLLELQEEMEALYQQVQDFLTSQQGDATIARRNAPNTFTGLQSFGDVDVEGTAVFSGVLRVPVRT